MLKELFDLKGKTVLVTGSSRGIGRGIALGLAEYGAHVILHGSRESEALREAQRLVGEFDPSVETWIADLGDSMAVETMPRGIDVLVANVSIHVCKDDTLSADILVSSLNATFNSRASSASSSDKIFNLIVLNTTSGLTALLFFEFVSSVCAFFHSLISPRNSSLVIFFTGVPVASCFSKKSSTCGAGNDNSSII